MYQDNHLHRINRMLMALSRVNQTILRVRHDRERLLSAVCRTIYEELSYEIVWIGEVRHDGSIVGFASQGMPGDSTKPTETPTAAAGIIRETAAHGRPTILRNADVGFDVPGVEDRTVAILPVPVTRSVTLVLSVVAAGDHVFNPDEMSVLQEMVSDVGYALDTMGAEKRTRQAEEALRISEDRFRRLAEHSLVGIVLIQNDLYRYVNPAFAEMFGYTSPGDIIDRLGPLDLTAPESRDLVADNIRKRVLGQVRAARYQYRGLRRDGRAFDVEEHGARTVHAQRLAVIATVLDVTVREASRRRLEALSVGGLALSAAQTPQQALDRAVEQIVGILPGDASCVLLFDGPTSRVAAQTPTLDAPSTLVSLVECAGAADSVPFLKQITETREAAVANVADIPTAEGSPQDGEIHSYAAAPLVVRGEMIGVLCTEAKLPDRFTDDDGQHLRLFADHVAATLQHLRLISSLEAERNRLTTLNRLSHALSETLRVQEVATRALSQLEGVLGADAGALFLWDSDAQTLSAVAANGFPSDTLSRLNTQLAQCGSDLADSITTWRLDRPNAIDQCGPHWGPIADLLQGMHHTLDLPLEVHGELVGILSFLSRNAKGFDGADAELASALSLPVAFALQNARYYERASSQAEAMADALHRQEELDRMKDELMQNVSHELRTPLALVMGYAEVLDTGQLGPMSEEQASAVAVIARRSRMLRGLVEDIALLWHLERRLEERESLDLVDAINTAVADFQAEAASRDLSIAGTAPSGTVYIRGVALQIRRVLDNLIGNALKFTPSGGKIDISLSTEEDWAVVAVEDTGIGVAAEHLEQIFERFYQVDGSSKRRYSGAGLGLALVKAIVERHGGYIRAMSPITDDAEHPGTRIVVRLPQWHPEDPSYP